MGVKDLAAALRHGWKVIAATVVVLLLAAVAVNQLSDRQYAATSQLYVSLRGADDTTDLVQGSSFAQRQVVTYANLVTAPQVLQPVIDGLQLPYDVDQLSDRIEAVAVPSTVLIDITVTADSPQRSADVANQVAEQFTTMVTGLDRTDPTKPSPVQATVVREATPEPVPTSPRPMRNLLVAGLLGLLLGPMLALLVQALDNRVRSRNDVARLLPTVPILGTIPLDPNAASYPLVTQGNTQGHRAEAFRTVRTNLQFLDVTQSPRTVVVTSSVPHEGKTTTALNLALTLAETGVRVCLVEADLRKPTLLSYLGLENAAGLTTVLIGRADLDDVLQTSLHQLTVLGSGSIPPNPSELLGSPKMRAVLAELRERYDLVLIDAPPLLPVTDAAILAANADGTLLVVGERTAHLDHVRTSAQMLESVNARLLGVVLNRSRARGPESERYYRQADIPEVSNNRRTQRDREIGARKAVPPIQRLLNRDEHGSDPAPNDDVQSDDGQNDDGQNDDGQQSPSLPAAEVQTTELQGDEVLGTDAHQPAQRSPQQ